jgi:beta-lactamase superfamily II metal-dependent hydrolase
VDTIEALVISHNDADHDYNAPGVLTEYRKAIIRIFFLQDRNVQEMSRTFAVLRYAPQGDYPTPQRLEANGGAPRMLYSAEDVTLAVMYPDLMSNLTAQNLGRATPNQTSAVLRLTCGDRRIIFAGDATLEAWEYLSSKMPNKKPLKCDIMTIPHHGGNITTDSSSEESYQKRLYSEIINPEYGVISVGTYNQYGHPSTAAIIALRTAGVKVLCTQITDKCCGDLESMRSLRRTVARPARSTRHVSRTVGGRSKHVACFGTVVAEISENNVRIANLATYEEDVKSFAALPSFHPICENLLVSFDN